MSGNIVLIASTIRHRCLAVCAPGLEALCAAELAERGVRIRRTLIGGVEFGATARQLYAANLWSRTASRIVVRVATYAAGTFSELERGAAAVPWDEWIGAGARPRVRASCTASRLYHTAGVAERIAAVAGGVTDVEPASGGSAGRGASESEPASASESEPVSESESEPESASESASDETGGEDSTGEPGPLIVARLMHDRVTLSVDSSGLPLWKRGWRLDPAKAPLRETLAAALVLASGWDRRAPLIDPFCGSGTIAIEAALMAAGRPPGGGRRFAFQDWPSFQPGTWASVAGEAKRAATVAPDVVIVARDRDAGAVRAAAANAERAGVADLVDVGRASVSDLEARGAPGWLVSNPPYGHRVSGGGDLRDLYARLGQVARQRLPGWTVALLAADDRLAAASGLDFSERLRADNGGIPVRVLVATVGRRPARRGRERRR